MSDIIITIMIVMFAAVAILLMIVDQMAKKNKSLEIENDHLTRVNDSLRLQKRQCDNLLEITRKAMKNA